MGAPEVKPLLSDEHFSVDGNLLQAWASHASLERTDGQQDPSPPPSDTGEGFGVPKERKKRAKGDFRGVKLSNKTHRSKTDPDALLARKSNAHPALPSYRGHVLMDNRHALIVDCRVTQAVGTGERDAAKEMAADRPGAHQKTVSADKGYDTKGFVAEMRRIGVTPHVVQNTARLGGYAIDGYTPATRATPSRSMPAGASRRCLPGSNNGADCASSNCAAPKRSLQCLVCT